MDVRIEYATSSGGCGFLAIEVKYAEDLNAAHRNQAPAKYLEPTNVDPRWVTGAASALDARGLRQFWYNQLLTHLAADQGGFEEYFAVVVAMADDQSARKATQRVSEQLADPSKLRFVALESIIDSVPGFDPWKVDFVRRYVDLSLSDGGRTTVTQDAVAQAAEHARSILHRVAGDGGVLEQLIRGDLTSNGDARILRVLDDLAFTARFARSQIGDLTR